MLRPESWIAHHARTMILTTDLLGTTLIPLTLGTPGQGGKSLTFNGTTYVHRYSKGVIHEFTPKSQSDLNKWADRVTLNIHDNLKDGDGLAIAANTVLEAYKGARGSCVRTRSRERRPSPPGP